MSRLLETIQINNDRVLNLSYHNERLNRSRKELFSISDEIDLADYILIPSTMSEGRFKCRVRYDTVIRRIEYLQYLPKNIANLSIIKSDDITYPYKYEDRAALTTLYQNRGKSDDVLIIKNGFVTDTYYCNVALLKNGRWITPQFPLLEGVHRKVLIDERKIHIGDIAIESIDDYESIRLFNSMLAFGEIELPISSIKKAE